MADRVLVFGAKTCADNTAGSRVLNSPIARMLNKLAITTIGAKLRPQGTKQMGGTLTPRRLTQEDKMPSPKTPTVARREAGNYRRQAVNSDRCRFTYGGATLPTQPLDFFLRDFHILIEWLPPRILRSDSSERCGRFLDIRIG